MCLVTYSAASGAPVTRPTGPTRPKQKQNKRTSLFGRRRRGNLQSGRRAEEVPTEIKVRPSKTATVANFHVIRATGESYCVGNWYFGAVPKIVVSFGASPVAYNANRTF
jgi:hypothetical protein